MKRVRQLLAVLAAAVFVCGGFATGATADEPVPQAVFTVHMAPSGGGGSDANDGLTPETAVASLPRVHEVLRANDPTTDVEVRIEQGTYVAKSFSGWRFYIPGHTISFMPIDYVPGEGLPDGGLPVFQNAKCGDVYCDGFWLQPRLPTDPNDPMYGGGDSNLQFYYLRVEYFSAGGVSVYGDSERDVEDETYNPPLRVRGSEGLNNNKFFGMQFRRLGSKWSGGDWGYGGIVLTNSSNNLIENSHFVNIENANPYAGHIHGLYITHFSSNNKVVRNKFSYISGYVVKSRNQSNFNTIEYNNISRAGRASYYRGEFCDKQCAIDNDMARQCASVHDRFFYNEVHGGYNGGHISNWSLSPEGLRYAGVAPCSIPEGEQRVYTGGNTS